MSVSEWREYVCPWDICSSTDWCSHQIVAASLCLPPSPICSTTRAFYIHKLKFSYAVSVWNQRSIFVHLPTIGQDILNQSPRIVWFFSLFFPWIWPMKQSSLWRNFLSFFPFPASKGSMMWGLTLRPELRSWLCRSSASVVLWTWGRSCLLQRIPGGVNGAIHAKLLSSAQCRSGRFHHWRLYSTLSLFLCLRRHVWTLKQECVLCYSTEGLETAPQLPCHSQEERVMRRQRGWASCVYRLPWKDLLHPETLVVVVWQCNCLRSWVALLGDVCCMGPGWCLPSPSPTSSLWLCAWESLEEGKGEMELTYISLGALRPFQRSLRFVSCVSSFFSLVTPLGRGVEN